MQQTRVAIVLDVPIEHLEDSINQRLTQLEGERHNVEIVEVTIRPVNEADVGRTGAEFLALILYRDFGSAAAADAEEERSTKAFNAIYRDNVH
jgi:hypothetical protein